MSPSSPDAAPSAPLRQLLHDALEDAHFVGHVEAADDGRALKATLYSHRAPFTDSLEANDWLSKAGVFATAALNEGHYVVITLPTAASVHQLIISLLTPWITAHTVAKQMVDLLETHARRPRHRQRSRPSPQTRNAPPRGTNPVADHRCRRVRSPSGDRTRMRAPAGQPHAPPDHRPGTPPGGTP